MRIPHALSFFIRPKSSGTERRHDFLQQNRQHPFSEDARGETGLSFRFSLTYEEAREAFLLIIDRRSPAVRRLMGSLLLGLGALCAYAYSIHPYGLHYALLGLLFAFFSFLVFARPSLKAGSAARRLAGAGGTYALILSEKGYFLLPDGEKLFLRGDSRSRAFETNTLFAIRPDRLHTVCLPKRSLRDTEVKQVRNILKTYVRVFHNRSSPDPGPELSNHNMEL